MDKFTLVDKLKDKANITYEDAKSALENNHWDILEAMVYLEELGIVRKPTVSVFYTNEYKSTQTNEGEIIKVNESQENNFKGKRDFEGVFEAICRAIDTCNNIFLEIKRKGKILLRLPFTVLILLLFFIFWIIIPLMVIGLFFKIEFFIAAKNINSDKIDKINKVFSDISKGAQGIVEKVKR